MSILSEQSCKVPQKLPPENTQELIEFRKFGFKNKNLKMGDSFRQFLTSFIFTPNVEINFKKK